MARDIPSELCHCEQMLVSQLCLEGPDIQWIGYYLVDW